MSGQDNFEPTTINDITNKLNGALNFDQKFPTELLLPKGHTQQASFIEKFPNYDGRGIVIAILDTGVDPALPGLQTTTTGQRKIIDCVDCSGAGDVDTSTIKTVTDGYIYGLTGRKLQIPASWKNPSGKYHVGVKPIFELYSAGLCDLIKKETRKEYWEPSHQLLVADVQRQMKKHEEAVGGSSEKMGDKLEREDLASQIDYLNAADRFESKGQISDCLVWHDGDRWMACLDTSFRGRLTLSKPMGSFKETGEFDKLTERDKATFSFRISPDGNWLEIVVANGAHGSHVANIAAAHFPEDPKRSGLAPGAQIVSLCIGDNRLKAMETGTALTRAFNKCVDYGVHVVNMSFGEGTHLPDKGRIIEEIQTLVDKHNVICCISAGNNGPALSTVGSPGGTTSLVLGIGACLYPNMIDPLYGVLNMVEGNLYPWSSRGPSPDGGLGVTLCAPGAAMTGVPKYCRQNGQMMNGTSMSSPNAAGSIACILSALLAENKSWTYYQVRMALENSAKKLPNIDTFSQGQGVVQIQDAYDYLNKNGQFLPDNLSHISVTIGERKGIYLRELSQISYVSEHNVHVSPIFREFSDPEQSIDFIRQILLKCDAPWVKIPETFLLVAKGRSFTVEVNPKALKPGSVNYAEIQGIDPDYPELGVFFRIPVTVIIPDEANESGIVQYAFDAHSAIPVRRFVSIPKAATAMEVKVTNLSKTINDRYVFHCVYLNEHTCFRNTEAYKTLGLDMHEWVHPVKVSKGRTMEICLARSWAVNADPAKIVMEVKFHGIDRDDVILQHGSVSTTVRAVAGPFRTVEVTPTLTFTHLTNTLKQSCAYKLEPLGPSDVFMKGIQIHRLLLTYKYSVPKACEVLFNVPGLSSHLYESPIDCMRIQVYTLNKEYICSASTYPDRYNNKLPKGEYIVQVQLRHPSIAVLENLRDTPLLAHMKLTPAITLDAYSHLESLVNVDDAKKMGKVAVAKNRQFPVYYGSIPDDKLKGLPISNGCILEGFLTMFTNGDLKSVDRSHAHYVFTDYSPKTSAAPSLVMLKEKEQKKEEKELMEESLRDLQISWLEKLTDEVEAEKLYSSLVDKYPNHLPLLLTKLKKIRTKKSHSATELELFNLIIQQIMEVCQPNEVLQFYGCRQDYNENQVNTKRDMERKREAIIEAVLSKAYVLADQHLKRSTNDIPSIFRTKLMGLSNILMVPENKCDDENSGKSDKSETKEASEEVSEDDPKVSREELDNAYNDVLKWIGADDTKTLLLSAKHAIAHGHKGRALKYLLKAADDGKSMGKNTVLAEEVMAEICKNLGWEHIYNLKKNEYLHKQVAKFRPFQGTW